MSYGCCALQRTMCQDGLAARPVMGSPRRSNVFGSRRNGNPLLPVSQPVQLLHASSNTLATTLLILQV